MKMSAVFILGLLGVGITCPVQAQPGSWERVGWAGDWKGVLAGAVLNGRLYAAESTGRLYETDPASGGWRQIGKADFQNTRLMFAAGGNLSSIETDGSLYCIHVR